MIKFRKKRLAVTIVELVAVLVVLGLATASLLQILTEVSRRASTSEDITELSICSQGLIERVRTYDFATINNTTGYCPQGQPWQIVVGYGNLSAGTWVSASPNNLYKLVNVTVTKQGSSLSLSQYVLISNYTD